MLREGMQDQMEGEEEAASPTLASRVFVTIQKYRKQRQRERQPVLGSEQLFRTCWAEEDGIIEVGPTGHDKCDECAD